MLSVLVANNNTNIEILSEKEIKESDESILKYALEMKSYGDVGLIGISYLNTSRNKNYKGDSKLLFEKAQRLINLAIKNYDLATTLYMCTNFLKSEPAMSRNYASHIIKKSFVDKEFAQEPIVITLVKIHASSVLDNNLSSSIEVQFAIKSLESVEYPDSNINLYLAFLYNRAGAVEIANGYLDVACNSAKQKTKIYKYCYSSEVTQYDPLENIIINKDCKSDISQRCQ